MKDEYGDEREDPGFVSGVDGLVTNAGLVRGDVPDGLDVLKG